MKSKTSQKDNLPKNGKNTTRGSSDITMCTGGECPFKTMCHRYTIIPNELRQSYFVEPPFIIVKSKPSCTFFWGDAADQLFIMLKSIMAGEKKPSLKSKGK
jgi:hypothetical protein